MPILNRGRIGESFELSNACLSARIEYASRLPRLAFAKSGMQYYKRINVYSGVFLLYFLALIVIIIFGALTGRSVDYTIVTLAIYNVMLYAIVLAQVLFYG